MNSKEKEEKLSRLNFMRGRIESSTGGWIPGKRVDCHGYSLLDELIGNLSYQQIVVLNATGRIITSELATWIEACNGCLSWPDPRIWCNQIGAIAGVAKASVITATTMGCLATDSRMYGVLPLIEGVRFIQSAMEMNKKGKSPKSIVIDSAKAFHGKPFIVGYKRPIAKGDERIEVLEKVAEKRGLPVGEHLELAYKLEEVFMEDYGEGMNVNGYMSAVLSDNGFTPEEVYRVFSCLVASGVTACYLETFNKDPEEFLPLRCDDIEYSGPAPRAVNVS